jgi:transposase-like protein
MTHMTTQESGWTYLSEDFIQDLERAITAGSTISSVLQEYGINRGTYYSWLAIGEGRMTNWRDGTPISTDMRTNCRRLYKRVLQAKEANLRARRQAL